MDFVGTAWSGLMNDFQTSYIGSNKDTDDLKIYYDKLKQLLKRKSNLHWHMEYFKYYIRENISPQGLRIQLFPTIKHTSQDLKNSWEGVLNKCSQDCMQLLLSQYSLDTAMLDQELALLHNKYISIKTHAKFEEKSQELKLFLDKTNKTIISKKQRNLKEIKQHFWKAMHINGIKR